jgi:hypothetical protein
MWKFHFYKTEKRDGRVFQINPQSWTIYGKC